MKSLTQQVHEEIAKVLKPGDWAVDATAGNGHDTVFLARCVGPTGRVWALDIQQNAVMASQNATNAIPWVTVLCHNHADMLTVLPSAAQQQISVVTFNLGYLPGGNHAITTHASSTVTALDAAYSILKPGGILSVVAYRGHAGGLTEYEAVKAWMNTKPNITTIETPGPVAWVAVQSLHAANGVTTG